MKTENSNVGKFRNYMLRATVAQRAKISALIFAALMLLGLVLPASVAFVISAGQDSSELAIIVLIGIVTAVLAGLLFYFAIQQPLRAADQKRNESLGREPTKDEIVSMYVWYKYGIKPTDRAIQPLLPKYLDYLETRLNGSYSDTYTASKGYRYFALIFAVFMLSQAVVHFSTIDHDIFIGVCNAIAGLAFLGIFLRKQNGKPRRLASKLNAKRIAKLHAMRQQL